MELTEVMAELSISGDVRQLCRRIIFIGCKGELVKMILSAPTHREEPDLFTSTPYVTVGQACLPRATYPDGSTV